jgi:hypothetical protein
MLGALLRGVGTDPASQVPAALFAWDRMNDLCVPSSWSDKNEQNIVMIVATPSASDHIRN